MIQMRKSLRWFIILFLYIVGLFSSCNPCARLQQRCPPSAIHTVDTIQIVQVKVDTFLTIQTDTSRVLIYIDCDSLNQPQIKEIHNTPGNKIHTKVKYVPHYIEVTSTIDSFSVYFSYYNTHYRSTKSTTIQPQQTSRVFNGWVILGIVLILAVLLFVLIKFK